MGERITIINVRTSSSNSLKCRCLLSNYYYLLHSWNVTHHGVPFYNISLVSSLFICFFLIFLFYLIFTYFLRFFCRQIFSVLCHKMRKSNAPIDYYRWSACLLLKNELESMMDLILLIMWQHQLDVNFRYWNDKYPFYLYISDFLQISEDVLWFLLAS